jgi:hypothetical protein
MKRQLTLKRVLQLFDRAIKDDEKLYKEIGSSYTDNGVYNYYGLLNYVASTTQGTTWKDLYDGYATPARHPEDERKVAWINYDCRTKTNPHSGFIPDIIAEIATEPKLSVVKKEKLIKKYFKMLDRIDGK